MRNQAAPRTTRGMLHMQHLVIQNVLHYKLWHTRPVHPPIQNNLIRPGIVTPKLPPPRPAAPRDVRPLQLSRKILFIQFFENRHQIGGGAAFFFAFSASFSPSSLPSTASSRLSL